MSNLIDLIELVGTVHHELVHISSPLYIKLVANKKWVNEAKRANVEQD